jgi:HrpA-like RNA helicase
MVTEYLENKKIKSNYELLIIPLYSGLSINEQLKIFKKAQNNTRKVILSTNIAETSVFFIIFII